MLSCSFFVLVSLLHTTFLSFFLLEMIIILPGDYGDNNDGMQRCPASSPTWCICKWATAQWIKGEGCNEVGDIFYNAAGLYFF